jgi:hypothetical protein
MSSKEFSQLNQQISRIAITLMWTQVSDRKTSVNVIYCKQKRFHIYEKERWTCLSIDNTNHAQLKPFWYFFLRNSNPFSLFFGTMIKIWWRVLRRRSGSISHWMKKYLIREKGNVQEENCQSQHQPLKIYLNFSFLKPRF